MTRRHVVVAPAPRETHASSRHASSPPANARVAKQLAEADLFVASASQLAVLAEADLDWIAEAIDLLEGHLGKPWRAVSDALDNLPTSRRQITAVRLALARLLGGAGKVAPMARRVREAVLGGPVLDGAARTARIAAASAALGVEAADIESLLFIDLRGERPIAFPRGRPSELEVAAAANIVLIQRALSRAHRVHLAVHGDDGMLLRAALARGLLVTAARASEDAATVLDIVGPLALFQRTAIYGRALGQLVPLLAHASSFELVLGGPEGRTRIAAPVLLPKPAIDRAGTYHPRRLARQLEELDPELRVIVGPAPVQAGRTLLCPDLAIEERGERWYVELVGFWTAQSLADKLEQYTAARARVKLCVQAARACGEAVVIEDPRIVVFDGTVDPGRLVATSTSPDPQELQPENQLPRSIISRRRSTRATRHLTAPIGHRSGRSSS